MDRCWDCRWSGGAHDPSCPVALKTPESRITFQKGWDDGRRGDDPKSKDETYLLGWSSGVVALEEAENGYRPGVDGGQW